MKLGQTALGTRSIVALVALTAAAAAIGIALLTATRSRVSQPAPAARHAERWRQEQTGRFSLPVPSGWEVVRDRTGKVTIHGESSERVVIWPFFTRERLDRESARSLAPSLATKALAGVTWLETSAPGPGAIRLTGETADGHAVAIVVYSPSRAGTAGNVYVTTAAKDEFAGAAPAFARILAGFRALGAPVTHPAAARFDGWSDPAEGAFSVEVPAGWSTGGGTERPSNLLVQATVRTTSPDSRITALMTDALPIYVEPSPLLAQAGITEGGTYVDPSGYGSPVQWYAPGARYVRDYVLPNDAPDARITRYEALPALAARLATYGINSYDAGEVEYRFARNGVPYTGGALCITEKIDTGGYVAWHVWRLFLVEAPSASYGEGVAALDRLAASFQVDRSWAATQAETTRRQSGIITQMSRDIGETLSGGYWERQTVYDDLAQRRSRAKLEVEDLTDADGTEYRVESGSSYYWIDPHGTIVGTSTDTRPDVDFRELVGVGR